MTDEVNKTKVEEFKIVEVKPGAYFRFNSMGNGELTDDMTKAKRYKMDDEVDDYDDANRMARHWFGKAKTLRITWEVE